MFSYVNYKKKKKNLQPPGDIIKLSVSGWFSKLLNNVVPLVDTSLVCNISYLIHTYTTEVK